MDRSWMYNMKRSTLKFRILVKEIFVKCAAENAIKKGETHILCPSDGEERATYVIDDEDIQRDRIDDSIEVVQVNFEDDQKVLESLLSDAEKPLYPNCNKFTRLSAVMNLMSLKVENKWSDKSFTSLLEILNDILPEDLVLPKSTYEAMKIMCPIGCDYEKIHACPKDFILYGKEYKDLHECPKCGTSRYRLKDKDNDSPQKKGSAAKVVWYLSIIPRFKQLFANLIDARNLRWHADMRKKDGKLRHPLDAPQWRTIDRMFPEFGDEARNLRLGLLKGKKACPICDDATVAPRLTYSRKNVYTGHRRFLPRYHPYRRMKKAFNRENESGMAPIPLEGDEVYKQVKDINVVFGKPNKFEKNAKYKKKSIFWNLLYWKHMSVRHCIDIMHVEKNVAESLIGTLLNIPGKTKDGYKARKDIEEMGTRNELAPQENEKRVSLPPACYTLSKIEKSIICECLRGIKVPHGYCSNMKNIVSMKDLRLIGLKSHDNPVLMQQFLPVSIRSVLPKPVRVAITRLCFFFNAIYRKVIDLDTLDKLQADTVETLCQFEMYFPPSFFDISVHLVAHLVREAKLLGSVHLRDMYAFE
ncbi:uncharacterized protein LOC141630060 [Silene latifolia]|uniref:uncharacterized protein LOC141630060 n=1 Tax=Silene latifolia TaxID=37657 RepID=UPI003D7847FC